MQTIAFHRSYRVFGIIAAVAVLLVLLGTPAGRDALAWAYLQSTEAIPNTTHTSAISLDRFDPTCPQCM
jgi:hypothetical protein